VSGPLHFQYEAGPPCHVREADCERRRYQSSVRINSLGHPRKQLDLTIPARSFDRSLDHRRNSFHISNVSIYIQQLRLLKVKQRPENRTSNYRDEIKAEEIAPP
jgi:hypothetical protein